MHQSHRTKRKRRQTPFSIHIALIAISAILSVTACTKPRAKTWEYSCPDGYAFTITYSKPKNMGDIAILEDATGTTKLPRSISASGAQYSNGATTFWSKGDEAMIMVGGEIQHKNCRIE